MPLRADAYLHNAGLVQSRSKARSLIESGRVMVNGEVISRASKKISEPAEVHIQGVPKGGEYASRAAYKLLSALEQLPITPHAKRCLDIGASSGGFTDVLLRSGAKSVLAVDVGTKQLVERLRTDPRVEIREQFDARKLSALTDGYFDLIVGDVSFISLTHLIPAIQGLMQQNSNAILLVKPQFEVGKELLPKGAVIREPKLIELALKKVALSAFEAQLELQQIVKSAITGQNGNQEFFFHLIPAQDPTSGESGKVESSYRMIESTLKELALKGMN